jgi:hypothetical protein
MISSTGKNDKMSKKISSELKTAVREASSSRLEEVDVDDGVGERRIRLSGRSGEVDDRRLGLIAGSMLYIHDTEA